MQEKHYDIAVIGGGPGGYAAAILAARLKASVVLIEQDRLGGTCLNVGCIPTKALIQCADAYRHVCEAGQYGVSAENIRFDFKKAMANKAQIVAQLAGGVAYLLKANKVHVLKGRAAIAGKNCLEVTDGGGTCTVNASNIIIATGAKEISIPGFEFDGDSIVNSTQLLSLDNLPKRLAIVGGGVVGVEFASLFNKLGVEITLVELMPRLLPAEDEEITGVLRKCLEKSGIRIHTGAGAEKAVRNKDGTGSLFIRERDGASTQILYDRLLVCVGRRAAIEGIGLEALGVRFEKGRILTNSKLQTNIPRIYAIGDVTASEQLAHVAYHEAKVAVLNILGKRCDADYTAVPRCIFSSPEIACVGLTEEKAGEDYDIKIARFPFHANGKALIGGSADGFVKMIVNKADERLLGVCIIGPKAAELIAEPTLAIKKGLTAHELADTIHAHPTLSEAIGEASLASVGMNLHTL